MKHGSRNGIYRLFRNTKLKYKLAWVYILAGFLPVLVLVSVTYFQMKAVLRDKETETINSYLYQATASMDNEIQIYNNLANYISYNQTLSQVLSSDYTSNYQMYTQFVSVMDPMLSSLMFFHDEVNQVTIYVDKDTVKHGTTLAPITEIENEKWFDEVMSDNKNHWFVDQKSGQV